MTRKHHMAPILKYVLSACNYAKKQKASFEQNDFCISFLFRDPGDRISIETINWEMQILLYEKVATKEEDPKDKMWDGPKPFTHEFDVHRFQKPPYKSLPQSVRKDVTETDYEKNYTVAFFIFEVPSQNTRYHLLLRPKTVNLDFGVFQKEALRLEILIKDSEKSGSIVKYSESAGKWVDEPLDELKEAAESFSIFAKKPAEKTEKKGAKKQAIAKPKKKRKK